MFADISLNFFTEVSVRRVTVMGFFEPASVPTIGLLAASIDLTTTPIVLKEPKPMLSALMVSPERWPKTRIWSPVRIEANRPASYCPVSGL